MASFCLAFRDTTCQYAGVYHVFGFAVVHCLCKLLGVVRNPVHRHNLTAHEYGLRECDGSEKHVVYVVGHGFLGYEGYGLGDVLSVGSFDGFACGGVLYEVELIGLSGGVKCLGGEELVLVEDGYLLLIVHVSSGEVECR